MPAAAGSLTTAALHHRASARVSEPLWLRGLLIAAALLFLGLFLVLPLALVFASALENGVRAYFAALTTPDALHAIYLTLLAATVSVPLGTLFGLAAGWSIAKFQFVGKNLLITLIDLPFSVSPVIAGLLFVLLFSPTHGYFGPWLAAHGIRIIFAVPGIIIATMFVTVPFVARELIPLMEAQGTEEEQSARVLGGKRLASSLARHAAKCEMGTALRGHLLQRPRDGRVRRGVRCYCARQRGNKHAAVGSGDALQRVRQLRGGVRRRLALGPVGIGDAGGENTCRMARRK